MIIFLELYYFDNVQSDYEHFDFEHEELLYVFQILVISYINANITQNSFYLFYLIVIAVVLKGQKGITQRDVRFTAVYIYGNKDNNGLSVND